MTEKLKNLMDEVTGMVDQDFVSPDLDAITSAGDRAVRRRRVLTGAVGLAVVAVVATGTVLLAGSDRDDKADFSDTTFRTHVPMWTEGSVLHTPDRTYDLGTDVISMTRTEDDVAYIGDDYGVYVFDGRSSERIGTAAHFDSALTTLIGDSDGTRVGWIDDSGDQRDFVIRDLDTGEEYRDAARIDPTADDPFERVLLLAVDDTTAYWIDARGTAVTDVVTGESHLMGTAEEPVLVVDAEEGATVRWVETKTGGDLGTDVVGPDGQELRSYRQIGTVGALSPDGRWAASLDEALVWDVAAGQQVQLDTHTTRDAVGYEWLDNETLMVITELLEDDDHIGLLKCAVPSGECSDVATVAIAGGTRVALPSFGLLPLFSFGGEATGSMSSEEASAEAPQESSTEGPE